MTVIARISSVRMNDAVRLGVVGLGYWGPNLARNFRSLPGAELVVVL